MIKNILIILLIFSGSFLLKTPGKACPIPVYRYALEFWDADPYSLTIFYEGPLDPSDNRLINDLLNASGNGIMANIELRKIDAGGPMDDITRGFLKDLSPPQLPWVVLRYPRISGINKIIWSGPLTTENVSRMVFSPAREKMAGMLVSDATAVWVLLESGDRRKDRAALDLLTNHLNRLERTLVLPDAELWWKPGTGTDAEEPVVKFEVITVSRDDPDESYLVSMLMNSEADLGRFDNEPIVFPIYGRGIALWAIVGNGINEWNISEAAEFLTGPCSCQAKLLNPGVDLLVAMDWDNAVENIADISLSNPLSGIGDFASREAEVRERLETATQERLGTAGRSPSNERESARVVYLDIFGDSSNEGQPEEVAATETAAGQETVRTPPDPGEDAKQQDRSRNVEGLAEAVIPPAGQSGSGTDTGSEREPATISQDHDRKDQAVAGKTGGIRNFHYSIIYILAGIVGLILISGVIIYQKNIR